MIWTRGRHGRPVEAHTIEARRLAPTRDVRVELLDAAGWSIAAIDLSRAAAQRFLDGLCIAVGSPPRGVSAGRKGHA